MLYFLFATGRPGTLRPAYELAQEWFPTTVPLGNTPVLARISDDGRWFALATEVGDSIAARRVRIGPDQAIAINGPALRCNGRAFGDKTIDDLFGRRDGRETTSLFRDMSGSFSIGAVNQQEGLVGFSSFDNTHPVYCTQGDGICAVSNRALPLARLSRAELDLQSLGWLVAAGNLFGPCTAYRGVEKVEAGEAVVAGIGDARFVGHEIQGGIWPSPDEPDLENLESRGWDDLTERLVDNVRAACESVDHTINLALTGGKDSRLVLALAYAAGVVDRLRIITRGLPSWGDSVVAAEVCRRTGAKHELLVPGTVGGMIAARPWSDVQAHVSRFEGMVSPWDSPGTTAPRSRSVTFEGIGGELYRGSHAGQFKRVLPTTVASMQEAFIDYHQPFDPAGVVRPALATQMREWLFRWVADTARRVRLDTLPEKFYVDYRLGHWNGPLFQNVPAKARVSPLLELVCAREFLKSASLARRAERFHYEIMRRAAPKVVDVPFYRDQWHEELMSATRRYRLAIKRRLGMSRSLWGEVPNPPRRWQWAFAETQRESVAALLARAKHVGLEEVVDVPAAIEWTNSDAPLVSNVNVKTLLSLASVSLTLLGEDEAPA